MNTSILQKIGLTKNEIKVYLTLLEIGSTSAGPLIKQLGMHRALVYEVLDLLINKGVVSYVLAANRKIFQPQDPQRLLEYISTKKEELSNQENELKAILPALQAKKSLANQEQEGTIYKGKKGLKTIIEDMLLLKKPWYVFGATGQFKELFGHYFTNVHKRRASLRIPLFIIFSEAIRHQKREDDLLKVNIRYLPEKYLTPATTYIYGENVAIIIWGTDPMAFVIHGKSVADSYRAFFDILWNTAKD